MDIKLNDDDLKNELHFLADLIYTIENRENDYSKLRLDNYYVNMLKKRVDTIKHITSKTLTKKELETLINK